ARGLEAWAGKSAHHLAALQIPDLHLTGLACSCIRKLSGCRGQEASVGAKRHAVDIKRIPSSEGKCRGRVERALPDGTGHQTHRGRTESRKSQGLFREGQYFAAGRRVPHLDRFVFHAGSYQLAVAAARQIREHVVVRVLLADWDSKEVRVAAAVQIV